MYSAVAPIIWVAILLIVLFLIERWIHKHMQGIAYLLTGSLQWSVLLYALILFPGVLLHEFSHWLMANLLGMRTGRFSVWPTLQADGNVRLGYVEFYKSHRLAPIRESLIGGAPLLFGIGAILLIGHYIFQAESVAETVIVGTPQALRLAATNIFATNDAWIWLYLLFAISNAMMPSPSDRQAWPLLGLIILLLLILVWVVGFQQIIWETLVGPVNQLAGYLLLAFSITIFVDILFIIGILVFEFILTTILGRQINYRS